MTIGPKIAEGREAEVFVWPGDAVVKLYRPGYLGYLAESAALGRLDGGLAPRLLDIVQVDGRHGLVLQRLDGIDMLALLERRPWRLLRLAGILAEAQLRIHAVLAPADLPELRQTIAGRIDAAALQPHLRDYALRALDELPAGDRLLHGDFHPGNALVGADRVSVIDWANATRGVSEADFARTMLLLQHADPLPGTSRLFRGLMAAGRSLFARSFASAHRRRSPGPISQVGRWAIVQAAARLAEGIAVERPRLVNYLDRALRRTPQ